MAKRKPAARKTSRSAARPAKRTRTSTGTAKRASARKSSRAKTARKVAKKTAATRKSSARALQQPTRKTTKKSAAARRTRAMKKKTAREGSASTRTPAKRTRKAAISAPVRSRGQSEGINRRAAEHGTGGGRAAPPTRGLKSRHEVARASRKPDTSRRRSARREDESEEPLVETPTSFNLDLRRTRDLTADLDEPGVDPNSAAALAAGDEDVDIGDAETVGDETPGGDNPTPDMDVVDLIGRSLGVEYQDNEELKGADKIAQRDRKRWELDPKSSEDYRDRTKK
jgi:hypothetical protein